MKTEELIRKLRESHLYAECPKCGCEPFRISSAILFDGTRPFPKEALDAQERIRQNLEDRMKELERRKKSATKGAEITAKAVGLGKNLEKISPTMKEFRWELPDCRFLGDPIDMISFNGFCAGRIDSISFIELKSGGAKMNSHQKQIRDAIADRKVSYKVFK